MSRQWFLLVLIAVVACNQRPNPPADTDADASSTSTSSGSTSTGATMSTTSSSEPTTTGGPDPDAACGKIVEACHPKDDGTDPTISDCHEVGHSGTAACIEKEAECIAYCEAAPPLGGGSSSSGGESTSGPALTTGEGSTGTGSDTSGEPSPVCVSYCECMGSTCQAIEGYPWGDDAGCLEACAGYDAPQSTCWAMWCAEAMKGALVVHLCEHAWGKFGLDECP